MYGVAILAFVVVGILALSPNGHTLPAIIPAVLLAVGMGAFAVGVAQER